MAEIATAIEQSFKLLAIGLIQESKTNPRKTFDAKGIEELAASITEQGIVEPLIVRPIEEKDAPFELVAGARRLRAARKAKLEEVPCLIRELTDDQALEIQVIENLQRRDLHPLEEAEGYKELLKRPQYHVEAIADKIGKSVSYVWQRLKLTELIEPAKKAFLEDQITAGHAVMIARLQPADQKEALTNCFGSEWRDGRNQPTLFSVRTLSKWIQDNIHLSLDGAPWQKNDVGLVPEAGACDSCPKRAGNSPALWPEINRAQTCTDRACYQSKLAAFVDRQKKELEDQGARVEKISDKYNPTEKKVLGRDHYSLAAKNKKRCPETIKGLYADGEKRGQIVDICVGDSCRIHKERSGFQSPSAMNRSAAQDKERAKEILKERATELARVEILNEVLKKTATLSRKDLELLAEGIESRIYVREDQIEEGLLESGPLETRGDFVKASDKSLARFLLVAALSDDLHLRSDAELLYDAAARRKIDVKAIEKKALASVVYDRAHKDRMQRWKGLKASGNTRFEMFTCQLCGRTEAEQSKGGWHWIRKNDKSKVAVCSDCDRLEKK